MVQSRDVLPEQELHGRVQVGIFTLAKAIDERIDSNLPDDLRPTWRRDFTTAEYPIARGDLSALIRVIHDRGPHRDDAREAFGVEIYRSLNTQKLIDPLRHLRNGAAHPDGWTTAEAEVTLSSLARFAKQAQLPCAQEIWNIRKELTEKSGGANSVLPPSEEEALRAQVADLQRVAGDALQERNELAQQVEKQDEEIQRLRTDSDTARQRAEEVEQALESLELEAGERSRLEQELKDLRSDRDRAVALVDAAVSKSRNADEAFHRTEQERIAAEVELARLRDELALERERADRAEAESEDLGGALAEQLSALEVAVAAALEVASSTAASASDGVPETMPDPGEPWPYGQGDEAWRLSRTSHRMTRVADEVDLATLLGKSAAGAVVDSFLAIRPTGGRVWVDQDGDASTLINGQLIYLGDASPPSAVTASGPAIGSPVEPEGRRYTLHRATGVECSATGELLRDVVGKEAANGVRDRLLQVRPKGGRIRVSREGVVATYADGGWVCAGVVTAAEWFPGHLH